MSNKKTINKKLIIVSLKIKGRKWNLLVQQQPEEGNPFMADTLSAPHRKTVVELTSQEGRLVSTFCQNTLATYYH
ncbi:MAG TPA: hypothetical protein VJB67_01405 [Patescibacteria group bacterium]|nr:hypothetical protein [Patescibacteria group bacterium]